MMIDYFWILQTVVVAPFLNCAVMQKVCLLLLHLSMQPKLGQALQALQFIIDHPYNFSNLISPIVICIMNIFAIFFTQLAGSILCIVTNDANGVLGGFVSYAVISDLPGQYFSTLAVDEVKKELEEADD